MHRSSFRAALWASGFATLGVALVASTTGCGTGGGTGFQYVAPYNVTSFGSRPSTGGTGGDTGGDTGSTAVDPCAETNSRKFITISMRNKSADFVHYFLVMVAFERGTDHPEGAVCADDAKLYTDAGYQKINAGATLAFGNYCITGPAYIYFHKQGQFRSGAGTGNANLGSAIAPSQGTTLTADNTFVSAGKRIPVPDVILFHNPGTGAGAPLKVAPATRNPCDTVIITGAAPDCQQDAFYYVDSNDLPAGSTRQGIGTAVRLSNDIQGSGCVCGVGGSNDIGTQAAMVLAPSNRKASQALCNEFFRGGNINFVFVREDLTPPYPQLVWQVTDSGGTIVHDYDERARIPN